MSVQYALNDVLELLRELEPIVKKAEKSGKLPPVIRWEPSQSAYRIRYMRMTVEAVIGRYKAEAARIAKYRHSVSRP